MDMHGHLIVRIVVGAFLGGIIGYERDLRGRPAGLRTHIIVALASATFMIVSTHFVYFQHYRPGDGVEIDASRIAASVVSGIGFLAGGAIFRIGFTVRGLTTAAGLWLVAAIGLSAGAGMFIESATGTLCGVGVLTMLRRFENQNDRLVRRKLSLVLAQNAQPVSILLTRLKALGALVYQTEYERYFDEQKKTSVIFELRLPANLASDRLLEVLEAHPGVRQVRLQPLV